MHVLLVDDDEATRHLVGRALLARAGVRVTEATNAAEALRFLEGNLVDVILSDYRMPGGNGIELLSRARDVQPTARRVLMSGTLHEDVMRLQDGQGCADFVFEKPVAREAWDQLLAMALDGGR